MNMMEFKKKWLEDLESMATGNHSNFCRTLFDCVKPGIQSRYFFNGESFYGDGQFSNPTYLDYNPVIEEGMIHRQLFIVFVLTILCFRCRIRLN